LRARNKDGCSAFPCMSRRTIKAEPHEAANNTAFANIEEVPVRVPWRLKWTLGQFAQPAEYRKHSAVLRSAPQFYFTTLGKLIPGLSTELEYLELTDGHVIPVRDFMTLYIYKEIFVDCCYDVPLDQSAPVIIDIGANSGLFALRIKQLYPSAKISCYEPFPANFTQLQNTISVNKLDSVTPLQKAVGARPGRAKLFIHKRNIGGHSFYATEARNADYVDVEVVDLPSILGDLDQEVDLLKLDCEGAEFDILMGLNVADARKIRRIIVETTSSLYDVDQLNAQMMSLGYRHQPRSGLRLYTQHFVA
jgi:FkbM family methyltransferase